MKELSKMATKIKQSSTFNITSKINKLRSEGKDVIGFGLGEPDFDTPDNINLAAKKAIDEGFSKYTESSGIKELRIAICEKLKKDNGLDYEYRQIVVSNGAKHALNNVLMTLLNPGDEVIIPSPYWLSYAEMVHMAGGVSKIVKTDEKSHFKVLKKSLEAQLTEKTKAIIINSPNNPTGAVYSESDLRIIADFAVENDIYVISDEIYEKLIYGTDVKHVSIASFNKEIYKRTILINGFSKSYSMTGWRVGYSASSLEIADTISNIQSHGTSNVNSIAQKAALEAITGSQDKVKQMRDEFMKRRDYIYDRAIKIKFFETIKPEGAFYLFINVSKLCGKTINGRFINDANDFAQSLLEESNVGVIPCADFGAPQHIRLSYSISLDVIKEGMNRIEKFINENY